MVLISSIKVACHDSVFFVAVDVAGVAFAASIRDRIVWDFSSKSKSASIKFSFPNSLRVLSPSKPSLIYLVSPSLSAYLSTFLSLSLPPALTNSIEHSNLISSLINSSQSELPSFIWPSFALIDYL